MKQIRLAVIGAALLITLALLLMNRDLLRDEERPRDLRGAAAWLSRHPADWIAASIVSDASLDENVPLRFTLWRQAHALADRLAPRRPNASAAFVRAGLFHWPELSEVDRKAVLAAAVPLLRDERVFLSMHAPLWDLTRDFRYLRRANPGTRQSLIVLRELAVKNGLFADYRALREDARRATLAEFRTLRENAHPSEILGFTPIEISVADEPLVREILAGLHQRPLDVVHDPARVHALLDYAVRHRLPLDGLQSLVRKPELPSWARARMALAMGDVDLASQMELADWTLGMREWDAYQVERALYEAGRHDAVGARMHLDRTDNPAASREVARILGEPTHTVQPHVTPIELGKQMATQEIFAGTATTLPLTVDVVQSDAIAPYIEIFVDDMLVAEGEVSITKTYNVHLGAGMHRLSVRLANPYTRGPVQRRVRLS